MKAKYVVGNPRNHPEGSWIIREGKRRWKEGAVYTGSQEDHWLERGYLVEREEEVSDGQES